MTSLVVTDHSSSDFEGVDHHLAAALGETDQSCGDDDDAYLADR